LPIARDAVAGVTLIEVSVGATVTEAMPEILDSVAEIVVMPGATAVARPVAETVIIAVEEEVQVANEVTSLVVPSLYVAVAVNCWLWPTTSDVVPVTAIDFNAGDTGAK